MKKAQTQTQTLLFALISLILGLATAATTPIIHIPQVYAENRQHTEDSSAAAIADCDLNDIEEADFECIASAGSEEGVIRDREPIPPPEPEPEPETATLTVCREGLGRTVGDTYSVTGNNPSPSQFELDSGDCQDVTIGPGIYRIEGPTPVLLTILVITGDCIRDPTDIDNAVGEIQNGETQTCTFTYDDVA
jgi:hypothetical protein